MTTKINYRGDFFGGITTAVFALPLALAFGVSSGAGALAGLYGAIFAGALAAVFGGTRVQITGPTGPMTVVMALADLMSAFAVGFVMAPVLFVARMADVQVSNAKFAFGADQIEDLAEEEAEILRQNEGRIVLFHVECSLSFSSAREVARILESSIEKDVLAIDLRDVPFIDSSAAARSTKSSRGSRPMVTSCCYSARENESGRRWNKPASWPG